jgi:hypothetical protein
MIKTKPLNIISKGTTTSDIERAMPKRFAVVFRKKADELRQIGALSYENKELIGNGDIIANRYLSPLISRPLSKRKMWVPP